MIDCTFILRVLTAIVWLAYGVIRAKFYVDWGNITNAVVAALSFAVAFLYGLSAYQHFMGL